MKSKFFLIGALFLCVPLVSSAGFVYPIQEMSKVECRFQDFSTLGPDCKMNLPVLQTTDYTKYKNDYNLFRRVYTILWGASYNYGWDVGNGGHQWVDIATAKGTPVYAVTEWKVVWAWELPGWGNTVKIQHTINGKTVYTNYAHMSKIATSLWAQVNAGTKVGEVGVTWNSTWNHLHFQVDLAASGKWPWYWSNCSEKNYDTIVNTWVCFDELNRYTLDPLLFLQTQWAIIKAWWIIEKPSAPNISNEGMLSREEILKREIEEFLKLYKVEIKMLGIGGNIELGKKWGFRISVTDKRTGRPFTGSFPWDMNFKYDKNKFDIFPTGILQINKGQRDFTITPKIAGKVSLDIYLWETFFKKISFWVIDTKKQVIPKSAVYWLTKSNVISETKKWVLYFKDNFWLNLVGTKFNGTYTLSSSNNSIKFCTKKSPNQASLKRTFNTDCRDEQLKNEVSFTYADTFLGLLLFNYKVGSIGDTQLLIKNSKWELISQKLLLWTLPSDLSPTQPYYKETLSLLNKWISTGINAWYFLPNNDLNRKDGVQLIKNYLWNLYQRCSTTECKKETLERMSNLGVENNDKYLFFTRIEFVSLVKKYTLLEKYPLLNAYDFRDLNIEQKNIVKDVLREKTWRDYFGETRYFQPSKNITRSEAAYIIDQLPY